MNRLSIAITAGLFTSLNVISYAQPLGQDFGPPTQEQPNKPRELPPRPDNQK